MEQGIFVLIKCKICVDGLLFNIAQF
jgi:hypothetical protein